MDPLYYLLRNNLDIVNKTCYPVRSLKEVASMRRGRFGHRPRNDPAYYGGVYPFIQTGNVVQASQTNLPITYTQTLNELGLSTSRLHEEESILITIAANIGFTAILNYPACFPDSLIALTPRSDVSIEYLNIYLRIIQKYIEDLAPQAAQKNINQKQLSTIPIIVPPKQIQDAIVLKFNSAYLIKAKKEQAANELLDSINSYLLGELGIIMPPEEDDTLDNRMFYVKSNNVLGSRFDPRKYTKKYQRIYDVIDNSPFNKKSLRQITLNDVSGSWGLDEEETDKDLISCLTIRATEFDNKYNLILDNNRTKYRKYKLHIYEKIALFSDDILIEKSGGSDDQPVGRVAFIEKEMVENNSLAYGNFIHKIVVNKNEADPLYVFEYLRLMHSIKVTEVMQNQTNGIRNLIMGEYFRQTIILPDIDTQKRIARKASEMRMQAKELEADADRIISKAKAQVDKILLEGSL